mmetsp:Transcript_925/g.1999  ORF Transcript_925/g.1999 Transcript_925/m.1999 type:complete len:111 (-) Transcript_925:1114-1446(-)
MLFFRTVSTLTPCWWMTACDQGECRVRNRLQHGVVDEVVLAVDVVGLDNVTFHQRWKRSGSEYEVQRTFMQGQRKTHESKPGVQIHEKSVRERTRRRSRSACVCGVCVSE